MAMQRTRMRTRSRNGDLTSADGTHVPVRLDIGDPTLVDGLNLWACAIEWSGLDLPGKQGFGADPLGARENTLTIVRSVLEMATDQWRIDPLVPRLPDPVNGPTPPDL